MTRRVLAIPGLRALSLVLLPLGVSLLLGSAFWNAGNLQNVAAAVAIEGIMCVGMTIVIIAGGFDLSIGSVMAMAGVIVMSAEPLGLPAAATLALAGAAVVGLLNGLLVTRLGINPFIATLATMIIVRAGVLTWTDAEPVSGSDAALMNISHSAVLGVPVITLCMLVLAIAGHAGLTRWRIGREIHALGSNEAAARASGLPTDRLKVLCYLACSLSAGIAGVLLAGRLNTGSPIIGEQVALNVITAVLLGGASLAGGSGTILGSIAGLACIGLIESLMRLMDVPAYWQRILQGGLLLAIIVIDALRRRRSSTSVAQAAIGRKAR